MAEYSCTPAFGWGIIGVAISGIRREAARLGLDIDPFPIGGLGEAIQKLPVRVYGDADAVDAFSDYMRRKGYDERTKVKP